MSLISTIASVVLVLLNVFIGIIAFLFIAIGAVLEFGMELFNQYARPMLDELISSQGGGGGNSVQFSEQDMNQIMSTIHTVAIPLMIAGIIVFVITFCGCCGVCCKNKILLMVYAIIISVLTITFITLGVWVYLKKEEYIRDLEPMLVTWVQGQYVNETATDICSLAINFLNIMDVKGEPMDDRLQL